MADPGRADRCWSPGIFGRLGIGMTPLALLLLVEQVTGRTRWPPPPAASTRSPARPLSPVAGRLADRVGPAPVLLVTAVAHPLALVGLLLAAAAASRRARR